MDSNDNTVAAGTGPSLEFDEAVAPGDISVIQAINRMRIEADDARLDVRSTGDRNLQLYLGKQDFTYKQEGQSREVIPKVPIAVEQMTSIIKRGMVSFGPYYEMQIAPDLATVVSPDTLRSIYDGFLGDLWGPNNQTFKIHTVISDGVKQALLKNLIVLKVHGGYMRKHKWVFEGGQPVVSETDYNDEWHLRIDLVRTEDYYPDPTGAGLYEIHRVERDLHEVLQSAEEGIYDKAAVKQLVGTMFTRPDDEELKDIDRNQQETTEPSFRKRVVIDEFWGTILDSDGRVAHRNVVAAVANEKFLIRPPEPNPFWHQESPFVAAPLVRVPHSVWHKAIFDHASDLSIAISELFNLMLDGGIASVHGIKQVRVDDLEDPGQIEGGIRQGVTLAVKGTLPHNAKVLETVTEGEVPADAMSMYEMLNREFNAAAMTNDLKMGSLPGKQVLATEIMESSQGQNVMLESMIVDLENEVMARALRKGWLNILQMADHVPEESFMGVEERRVALTLMKAKPEERYALFVNRARFIVNGLSSMMSKALDFQKFMAINQAVSTNPALAASFQQDYSPKRIISHLFRVMGLNSENFKKSTDERQQEQQQTAAAQQMGGAGPTGAAAQLLGQGPQNAEGQAAGVAGGPGTGGSPGAAQVQQLANPATGMPPMAG
jgi:hypothetical protein